MAAYEVKSQITGTVWRIMATVGQRVEPDEVIMIIEAMKMEMPLSAESGGTIKEIRVAQGAPVSEGQTVAILDV